MVTMIPVAPSLNDPEVAAEVSDLINKRDHADYNCYMILRKLEQNNFQNDDEDCYEDEDDLFTQAREAIEERQEINNQFLMKLSGNG